ncbi:MAG: hypothetical protein KA749_00320 [Acidovorax sp.]|uniref:hypothetical protein n=1 Tax=unclassified Acidovorax TaxID=2684926 RepID=UPI001B78C603|nr:MULTISPECIES: hypothetical protein [unclassified Acidovorax]MBP6779350.1 hypothetical protein [Ottowia sp.]MBP7543941.1 hypothetical protein [Acidovorax sp.]MBV7460343.1 hypothetical protein [Acidovorax sp. sif0632]MBV7465368.1 hypothetical protein [Acidovorax sp. sif0613]
MLTRILVLTTAFLAGCSTTHGAPDVVNVHILPTKYHAGSVSSDLATPVVDAVVHLRPKSVHVSMCRSTPAAKVIQFQTELRARHDVQTTAGYYKVCPETATENTAPADKRFGFQPDGMLRALPTSGTFI